MELFLLIPVLLVMGGVAVYMALNEHPMPMASAGASASSMAGMPSMKVTSMKAARELASPVQIASNRPAQGASSPAKAPATEAPASVNGAGFNQTDVLLADALTEMIGLKTELHHLRGKLESLNAEVARISGEPSRTPPAVSKLPVEFRKAA